MNGYKCFVGKVNEETFEIIKKEIRRRGLNVQSSVVLGLIGLFELPMTLEDATKGMEGGTIDEPIRSEQPGAESGRTISSISTQGISTTNEAV